MTVIPLPSPAYQYGKVVGRVIHSVADTSADPDPYPQAVPASGTVKFTPVEPLRVVTSPVEDAAFVTHEPYTADLDAEGRIVDAEGNQGIWLVTGTYDVTFNLTPRASAGKLRPQRIAVTTAHTDLEPLRLPMHADYVPPANTTVQTLQVPAGWEAGQFLAAGDSGLTWATGAVSDEMVTDLAGAAFPTVAAMVAANPPLGTVTQTLGYYEAGDGGACRYIVQGSALKSYDIAGTGVAFRPAVNGTIHPKQFGTINNGSALDNLKLQACYDYAADLGIATIDGQGLTYTIGTVNPYDAVKNGYAHTGALVESGRTITNFRFKTASGSTNGTVPLAVKMLDNGRATFLRNIYIDGNLANLAVDDGIGRGDGGCHGVHLHHPAYETTAIAARDFYKCGNVYFENVTIENTYSYGGWTESLDCLVEFKGCTFNVRGIAFPAHSTRFRVIDTTVNSANGRVGKVRAPFQNELEFADNYSGTKRQSFEFRRVKFTTDTATSALFQVYYPHMRNVAFDSIKIEDCHTALGAMVNISSTGSTIYPDPTAFNIGRIEVRDCTTGGDSITIAAALGDPLNGITIEVGEIRIVNKAAAGHIRLSGATTVALMRFDAPEFAETGRIVSTNSTVNRLLIENMRGTLGDNGVYRDTGGGFTVGLLEVRGGEVKQGGLGMFDGTINRVIVDGLVLNPSSPTLHSRLLFIRNATAEISLRNILLTGTGYLSTSHALVYSTAMTGGFIHMSNVRHKQTPAEPLLNVASLPAGRIVKENVAPLYTS